MQSRLSNFWTKHKFLIICVTAYVIVFIINGFYNPWDIINDTIMFKSDDVHSYLHSIDIENRFLDKIPLKFLGFGIVDVAECVHNSVGILCGFIAYAAVLSDYLVKKYYNSNQGAGKFEIFISCYLCDNMIFYVMSIVVQLFYNTGEQDFFNFMSMPFDTIVNSKIEVVLGVIWIIICLLIILPIFLFAVLPWLATYIYFFGYLIAYQFCTNQIENINDKIMQNGQSLLFELIMFILAFLIIIALNLLLSKTFEIIRGWSVTPAKVYINIIRKIILKFRSRR